MTKTALSAHKTLQTKVKTGLLLGAVIALALFAWQRIHWAHAVRVSNASINLIEGVHELGYSYIPQTSHLEPGSITHAVEITPVIATAARKRGEVVIGKFNTSVVSEEIPSDDDLASIDNAVREAIIMALRNKGIQTYDRDERYAKELYLQKYRLSDTNLEMTPEMVKSVKSPETHLGPRMTIDASKEEAKGQKPREMYLVVCAKKRWENKHCFFLVQAALVHKVFLSTRDRRPVYTALVKNDPLIIIVPEQNAKAAIAKKVDEVISQLLDKPAKEYRN